MEKVLPVLQIAVAVGAAAVYVYYGDWKRGLYWFSAAMITTSVTI